MALNFIAARTLLKQFVALQTSGCPEYFCPDIATVGLSYHAPEAANTQGSDPLYRTYELRVSATDVQPGVEGGSIPLPSGTYACGGYKRDIIGEIQNKQIVEHLQKMSDPATSGDLESTQNEKIIMLGENTNSSTDPGNGNWTTVTHFILCNNYGAKSVSDGEYVIQEDTGYKGICASTHLVLFGTITSGSSGQETASAIVVPGTVPLFRTGNFKLTFSSN